MQECAEHEPLREAQAPAGLGGEGSPTAPLQVMAVFDSAADAPRLSAVPLPGGATGGATTRQQPTATVMTAVIDAVAVGIADASLPARASLKRGAPSHEEEAGSATKIEPAHVLEHDMWQKEADLVKARRTMFWRSVDEQDDEAADALHRAPGAAARKAPTPPALVPAPPALLQLDSSIPAFLCHVLSPAFMVNPNQDD